MKTPEEKQADKLARDKARQDEREKRRKENFKPLHYVVWLLGRREYSRAELLTKLKLKEVSAEEAEKVLDRAAELGLQSDERFLSSKVRSQKSMGKGPNYILAHLRQHKLPEEAVNAQVQAEDNDWGKAAFEAARRKFGPGPYDRAKGTKVFNFLLQRGFAYDHARQVCSSNESDWEGESW